MTPPWLRLSAWLLTVMAAVILGAATLGLIMDQRKNVKFRDVPARAVAYADTATAIERGRHLYFASGCAECHGANGAGKSLLETEDYSISAPNLTTGPGSVTFWYTEVDWDRAIRHGVAPDGRGLRFMPSEDFARWSDRDLAAVVAWIRTLPPTIGTATTFRVPVLRRIARGYGLIPDAADRIDHSLPAADPGDPAPTAEYGTYVAAACVRCHGEGFSGGPIPGALPGWPPAPNLTPGYDSAMVQYADFQEFAAVFTRNERPDGTPLSASLPRSAHGSWNDTELRALYELLLTLPPRPFGNR